MVAIVSRTSVSIGDINVTSCCVDCNYMKRKMGVDEFKEHIARIFKYLNLGEK